MFHGFCKLKIPLATLFSCQKTAKVLWTFFDCVGGNPMPSSVWYLQWRVELSPSVLYSVLRVTSSSFVFSDVLFL